jgi:ribosomal protein S18 acetylase RimI-like enzyme
MENITSRSCDYYKDQKRLSDFWLDCRAASDVRKYPTIWRTRLLLSSRVWNQEKDSQIWENESTQIIGFAMLWRRQATSSYVVLDCYLHPTLATNELFTEMLQWGDSRANQIANEQEIALTSYITGAPHQDFAVNNLNKYGYSIVPPNPIDFDVYFSKSLQDKITLPSLPSGYKIYKLQNVDELQAYQALYGFAQVNPYHQKELIESDEYSHFVVENPTGEFVAYCECSACYDEWKRTNQQIGWIDYVETKSDEQKKGLGQAILTTGLLHLQKMGADTAMLITINSNSPAVALYNKTGFNRVEIKDNPSYEKQIPAPNQSGLMA